MTVNLLKNDIKVGEFYFIGKYISKNKNIEET